MNIVFFYDNENKEINDIADNIINYCKDNKQNKFKIINKLTIKTKQCLYVIISDDILKINEYIFDIDKHFEKVKDNSDKNNINNKNDIKNSIVILTGNLAKEHILSCVDLTNNLFYMKTKEDVIVKKLENITEKYKVLED